HGGPATRWREPGPDGCGPPPQRLPLRAAVQASHRAAAAPVRDPAPRRAGEAASARRRLLPGGGRRARRLLGPERVLSSLQAPRRRHAATVPYVRKHRLKAASHWKEPNSGPTTIAEYQ